MQTDIRVKFTLFENLYEYSNANTDRWRDNNTWSNNRSSCCRIRSPAFRRCGWWLCKIPRLLCHTLCHCSHLFSIISTDWATWTITGYSLIENSAKDSPHALKNLEALMPTVGSTREFLGMIWKWGHLYNPHTCRNILTINTKTRWPGLLLQVAFFRRCQTTRVLFMACRAPDGY